jgi:hypothetical protein
MPYSTECSRCGKTICYDVPDEIVCECGWTEQDDYEEGLRIRCESLGEDYEQLLQDLGGDAEAVDGYTWAMDKDD